MQLVIDSCKRLYIVDNHQEIERISKLPCMDREQDFPEFMLYTRTVATTKNGKPIKQSDIQKSRDRLKSRIDHELQCPMNDLVVALGRIRMGSTRGTVPNATFIKDEAGSVNWNQVGKIRSMVEQACYDINLVMRTVENEEDKLIFIGEVYDQMAGILANMKIRSESTMIRLIRTAFELSDDVVRPVKQEPLRYDQKIKQKDENKGKKNGRSVRNHYTRVLLDALYRGNPEKFISCFIPGEQ